MKAESPEVRGVISRVFDTWDPAVFMDCHTTDGSYHVEPVTFTWMVNPGGDTTLIKYMRDKMVPEMSSTLLNRYKVENCYYGEFNDGLRNRLGILNENYVYADFRSRVMGCYYLIWSLGEYVMKNGQDIKQMLKAVDTKTIQRGLNPAVTDSFAISYKVRPAPEPVTIKTYEAELVTDANGRRRYQRSDRQKTVTIPYYIDYYPIASVQFPFAYLLTVPDPQVISLLKLHGIKIEELTESLKINAEKFEIVDLKGAQRLNQGHYTNTITGRFVRESVTFTPGTIVIRSAQPLANVAAYLLEPQSNDGLVTWNFLDKYLVPQWGMGYNDYPVFRVVEKTELKTKPVD